ncbi:uncharacterized protein LOC142357427 [Convolutriloba macropyga]|uniref:uncharacterized protein LOC142340730 n=1 Tax=Convolutriloba macropyga TaxID=536237 RepID=UPI003F51E259
MTSLFMLQSGLRCELSVQERVESGMRIRDEEDYIAIKCLNCFIIIICALQCCLVMCAVIVYGISCRKQAGHFDVRLDSGFALACLSPLFQLPTFFLAMLGARKSINQESLM